MKGGFALAVLVGAFAVCGGRQALAQAAAVQWKGVDRVVAFADVHGAYAEMRGLLRETGIIDGQDRWAAGKRPSPDVMRYKAIAKLIDEAGFTLIDTKVDPNNPRQGIVIYTDRGKTRHARLPLHGDDLAADPGPAW